MEGPEVDALGRILISSKEGPTIFVTILGLLIHLSRSSLRMLVRLSIVPEGVDQNSDEGILNPSRINHSSLLTSSVYYSLEGRLSTK